MADIGITGDILYESWRLKRPAEETFQMLLNAEDPWKRRGFVGVSVYYRCEAMAYLTGGPGWVSGYTFTTKKLKNFKYSIYQDNVSPFHLNIKLLDFVRPAKRDNPREPNYDKGPDL